MKKLSFIMLIFLSFFWSFIAAEKSKAAAENINNEKKAIYFYQETCAHCQAVDKYFQENGIYEKYDIKKIEISGAYNLNYLNEFFSAFDISSEKRGWPAIFFDQKFLVGDKPIQENFVNEIEKTEANDFPDPENIRKNRAKINSLSSTTVSTHFYPSLLILLGASLADSVSPCVLAIFVILASIIIFGNPEDKKEIFIFGIFFLLSIFLTYLVLGFNMLSSGEVYKFSENLSRLLGLVVIFAGIFVLRKLWHNSKIAVKIGMFLNHLASNKLKSILNVIWNFTKENIQKMNLAIVALLMGFISSGFLFPCASKPYGVFANSLSGKENVFSGLWSIFLYNLIFILPIVCLSGIIYWLAHTKKLEIFRLRHDKLIRIIVGIGLLFTGSYFVCSNCFWVVR